MLLDFILVYGHSLQPVVLGAMEHNRDQCHTVLFGIYGAYIQSVYEQAFVVKSSFYIHAQNHVHCGDNDIFPLTVLFNHSDGIFHWS